MEEVLNFHTIKEFNTFVNNETLHPLVNVVHLDKSEPCQYRRMSYDFYTVFFKKVRCGDLRYGLDIYDYEEGTLVFLAPGQVIGENQDEYYQPAGLALTFSPDLIHGTSLGRKMSDYTFFSYAVNEALHVSEQERRVIADCIAKIEYELAHNIDKHSKQLIISNIELFLNYCQRFYDRQFITRENVNKGILERFEELLNSYFSSDKPMDLGIPTVSYCAEQLYLSSNYFGDLIKKETGKTPQDYIKLKLVDIAKELISDPGKSLNEIAFELGFKYPQHFSRFFKNVVGKSPNEYRSMNLN